MKSTVVTRPSPILEMDRVARRQHGLVTRAQLIECGLSRRQIERMISRRLLRRARRGIYATVGAPVTWKQAAMAAQLRGGDGAVVSHSTAARLWEFRYAPDNGLELTVPRAFPVAVVGTTVHRSLILPAADITRLEGIPCTSYERTLCDETTDLSWSQIGRVLDDGLRRKVTTLDRLRECAAHLDSGPHRRLTVVQSLLAQRVAGFDPGGSNAERNLLDVFAAAALPLPQQQVEVRPSNRTYYLDYAWKDVKVFAEWYGLPWHVGASAVTRDNARLTDLSSTGWRPLIFTDESSDAEIVTKTRQLLVDVGLIDR